MKPRPALFHWARATGHESPGRAQLACSIARVAGCLHTDVSSPWLTHDWSDVRWEFDLRQAVGVGGLTAAAGIAIRSASCQQPRVAALTGAAASSLVSRLSAVLLLSVFYSHSPRADCAPHQQDTCSCKQCENLVAPLSGGAALEEAAAWEAQQMEAARHAKELQSQYWGRQRQQRARRDWQRLSG
ncbi:hypothetical protein EMIHUDRAFT_207303 [Emiliania huxleyi CCMP1516]|uniref:Uncharacterized protein n=2 Tax=Emiliania huxleyi TaxID=2903 RepID=A0A0D3JF83_EMIH1|nr:hypothetical protein EMIHUDRAFT_248964 [Emiliania huxleyi CCMP1516]XP_005774597.1 hypothetical protein EMIHUDRAFT_207303 [Emiliania huxleyi CCMP1516]EOD08727.1 hypothetical protein EMIHUDRAFT_248964 [Emiliania huxleyi CCMP1516]EOD22168.1 hypothetical protein EMIHUDRAFT_207303 [Emiliania huxleyi CCMP1516]|eukprot:XP_005761156.1 hypothetical protein EMIHUDRAFT_248964 [Emiliania huxleyi CCMP1516]